MTCTTFLFMITHLKTRPEEAAYIPCERTANAQIKLLSCIHCQGFIAIRFTQAIHGVTDVCVGDRTEFCTINTLLPGTPFVHHWLNGIQYLLGERNHMQCIVNYIYANSHHNKYHTCTSHCLICYSQLTKCPFTFTKQRLFQIVPPKKYF